MKRRVIGLCVGTFLIVLVLVLLWPRLTKRPQETARPWVTNLPVTTMATQAVAAASASSTNHALPGKDHPAVKRLYEFAEAARLYNFNPEITGYREQTSPRGEKHEMVGTPSHVAQVLNGKLLAVNSLYDSSDTRRKPEAINEWYQATAKWTEAEAVKETIAIMERLGETNILNDIKGGKQEFQAIPIRVKTPEGAHVHVVAFPTVRLYNAADRQRVTVEFRMGPTNVLGVTEWFCY